MKRVIRNRRLTPEEAAKMRAARAEFAAKPTPAQVAAGDYTGPMSLEEFFQWRKNAGDAPLAKQLKAAVASCGQSLYAVSQASSVPAPVLQRFMNDERGITLETAGKLAVYLQLALVPQSVGH